MVLKTGSKAKPNFPLVPGLTWFFTGFDWLMGFSWTGLVANSQFNGSNQPVQSNF